MILLAVVPAWVPGNQQDAHKFLLSIFQILDEEDRGGSQCIRRFQKYPSERMQHNIQAQPTNLKGKYTKGKVLVHTRHKCQSNQVVSGPKWKQINQNVNPKCNP